MKPAVEKPLQALKMDVKAYCDLKIKNTITKRAFPIVRRTNVLIGEEIF